MRNNSSTFVGDRTGRTWAARARAIFGVVLGTFLGTAASTSGQAPPAPESPRGSLLIEQQLMRVISSGDIEQALAMTGSFASPEVARVMNRIMEHSEGCPTFTPEAPFFCFSADAPPKPEVIAAVNRAMLQFLEPGYNLASRWSGTTGTPRALTWSFIPDGTNIPAEPGLTAADAPSNLFAQMDSKFAAQGGRAAWIAQFQSCFDRWAALTGTSYTRITTGGTDWDDGASFPGTAGAAGSRGDCRIGGRTLDGVNGVLAYNFFPSTGDMVLDMTENWGSSTNTFRFLRDVVMHEHGHGLGLQHVCSSNSNQLMEPFINTTFDGPQQDDLRAGQRHYGDAYESNNTSATATILGNLVAGGNLNPSTVPAPAITNGALTAISVDGDLDWFRFTTTGTINFSATLTPLGSTYDSSPQNSDGSCASGNNVDALSQADLVLTLYAANGTTVLTTANATGLGGAESIINFSLATIGNYFIRVSENNAPTQSQIYTLSMSATAGGCTAPAITAQPSNTAACVAANASFTVGASGTTPSFQWRRGTTNLVNGGAISGATTPTLTITGVVAGDAGTNYNCVVTNACGTVTSANATLTVQTAPAITTQPTGGTACTGSTRVISLVASGSPAPTYQWRRGITNLVDGGTISGATTATLTITGVTAGDAGNYTCLVTNVCDSVTSNIATLAVSAGPGITSQPTGLTRCTGTSASFSIAVTGGPTLQWRKNGVNIGGATGTTYSIPSVVAGDAGTYDCVVTNSCGSITSDPAVLTVNTAPSISTQPSPLTRCEGTSATFSVVAGGTPAPTFQWRKNASNISGATGSSYTIPAVAPGDAGSYDCVVTNACGSVTSNAAALAVQTAPSISSHPVALVRCEGAAASFSVVASGTPSPTFQWRKNTVNISGATSSSYAIPAVATADAGAYDCVVTNACGSVTSNPATLTVNTAPTISTHPAPSTRCVGDEYTFSIAAGGTPAPTYQWRLNGSDISGATSSALGLNNISLSDQGSYDCVVTNACGSVTSSAATLTVQQGPSITTQPTNQSVSAGASASFSVAASGTPALTYVWRKAATPLSNGGAISGADSPTLTINPAAASDAGSYDVVVSNVCGSTTSDPAVLTVSTGCVADVDDGSGTGTPDGGVTIDDLLYYLFIFENGLIAADVDDGSATGTPDGGVTIDDLLYYLFRFENGC